MEMSNNTKAKIESFKNWLVKYSKIILPVILVLCVALTVVIAIQANKRKVQQEEAAVTADGAAEENPSQEVTLVPLEEASPEITEMFDKYYTAMVKGDTETMSKMVYYMDAADILRASETGKYIEDYSSMEVYTKAGPRENTYMVFVYADLKFYDYDELVPGMRTYYVCTDEDGELYINEKAQLTDTELNYMRENQVQDNDVIDLNNKANVAYKDMIDADETLVDFLLKLDEEIDATVGEAMASAKANEEANNEGAGDDGEPEEGAGDSTSTEVLVTKVKTTEVVNIRTSDSETADKLGKAAVGDEFKLLETKGNGWSKVEYDGKEAYIKSDYLEPSETETQTAAAGADNEENTSTQQANNEQTTSTTTTGTVTVKENVRVRAGASEKSEKIATAYAGEKLEVIMKQADGWTKIKYKGKTAYVKSDYVE